MRRLLPLATVFAAAFLLAKPLPAQQTVRLSGKITDADTGALLPARIYIQAEDGSPYYARSDSPDGSAVKYRVQRSKTSYEFHTTLSAHPFSVDVPPGQYQITVEHGKEYFPLEKQVTVGRSPVEVSLPLKRWSNVAERGWYSGDTHVHRTVGELPNVMLAEDVNVALPLTYWVRSSDTPPTEGDKTTAQGELARLIRVDLNHVIYTMNTEYEIFSVGSQKHTLGAFFVLNHQTPLVLGVPPVVPVAEEARKQGALLDLDKHSWPWSLMLVPMMKIDLYELSNNHIWRTDFYFRSWTVDTKPEYMNLESDSEGLTEWGWMQYGFQTYYALLNCGYRLRPSAGTASGVHPVPLGFGRVYVQLPGGFDYSAWIEGLNAGRSFVTTGPMLLAEFNGGAPGRTITNKEQIKGGCKITGTAQSALPLDRIEILVNGEVAQTLTPQNKQTPQGAYESRLDAELPIEGTSWVAVRCFEPQPNGKLRFAHTAPVYYEVPDHPLRPRKAEVEHFIRRIEEELARNQNVLDADSLSEYTSSLNEFRRKAETAR